MESTKLQMPTLHNRRISPKRGGLLRQQIPKSSFSLLWCEEGALCVPPITLPACIRTAQVFDFALLKTNIAIEHQSKHNALIYSRIKIMRRVMPNLKQPNTLNQHWVNCLIGLKVVLRPPAEPCNGPAVVYFKHFLLLFEMGERAFSIFDTAV